MRRFIDIVVNVEQVVHLEITINSSCRLQYLSLTLYSDGEIEIALPRPDTLRIFKRIF